MISIARTLLKDIVIAAQSAYPNECCGLVVGRVRSNGEVVVSRVCDSPNLSHDPAMRFEIDAQLRFDLMRELEGGPERILGHYHSHPDRPAQPSQRDLDQAWEPDMIWLIVSVEAGEAIHTTAHVLDEAGQQFREIPLRTMDWEPYPSRPTDA